MFGLIIYELKKCVNSVFKQCLIMFIILLGILIVYMTNKGMFFNVAELIYSLPHEIYELLGLSADINTGNFLCYFLFVLMIINVCLIWKSCERTFDEIYDDEITGRIFILCNQLFNRKQLCTAKYLVVLIVYGVECICLNILSIIAVCIGCFNEQQRVEGIKTLGIIFLLMLVVGCALISITFLFVICRRRNDYCESWNVCLILGTLIIGNLYKLRNLLNMAFKYIDKDFSHIFNRFGWLDYLRYISPLSCLNPYSKIDGFGVVIIIISCIVIAISCFFTANIAYAKRDFYSNT